MNADLSEFRRGVVAPVECIKEGWALIKDQYWLFLGISLVGILIGGAVPIVLLGPMMIGLFLCLLQRQRGEPVEFGTLFKGFEQFVPGLVVAALKTIPIIIIIVPYYIFLVAMMATSMPRGSHPSPEDSQAFVWSFFGVEMVFGVVIMVVSMLLEIFFMFAFPLIADRKLSGLDAVKLSFRAGKANIGGIIGLILLNGLLAFVGVLCCIIGVYFYLPIAFASQVVAYRRVFPDIGQKLPSPPPPPGNWA
ncbi:MAG TPA: hypothetical protein VNF70_06605 [Pyrinomonadaceae bacterium]|nr:hypothetical protein [Pyrinomonadaceae bacterium]